MQYIKRVFIMIKLKKKDYDTLLKHCTDELPNEACAILAGRDDTIAKVYTMENIRKQPDNFFMAPEEQFRVVKDIRKNGLAMLGIFHSHPDAPARPSRRDISMALYPEVVYFIISLTKDEPPDLKGFRIVDEKVTEEEIKILE